MNARSMAARTLALFSLTATTWAFASLPSACSSPDTDARIDPVGPSVEQFAFVAPMMVRRCGSIDCHGSRFRNLRIYGYGGLRVDARPDNPLRVTPQEAKATYDSVVGLEPEVMRDVVKSGGDAPERLTLVRKAREEEEHKGLKLITKGDDADVCLTSWLKGAVVVEACNKSGCVVDGGIVGEGCEGPP